MSITSPRGASALWNTGPCSSRLASAPTTDAQASYSGRIIPGTAEEE